MLCGIDEAGLFQKKKKKHYTPYKLDLLKLSKVYLKSSFLTDF